MKYTKAQVTYHWATAMLIAVMALTGMGYTYEWWDDGAMVVHQIAGQGLIIMLLLRLITRIARPAPGSDPAHASWERGLAHLVHLGLYAVLIIFVVTGYISASALGEPSLLFPVNKGFARSDIGELILEIHFATKWALLALLTLHIGGALKHAVWDKDRTLSHMTFDKAGDSK